MTAHLLALAAANLCFLAAGAGIGRALGLWRAPRDLPGVLAILYLIGVAASGLLATWALVAGVELSRWQVVVGCALLAAAGAAPVGRASLTLPPAPPLRSERVALALRAAVAFVVVLLLVDAAYRPLAEWDAWAMWTMKAKAVTLLGGLDARVLAGVPYHHLHLDYPLLFPAVEAIGFRFMGSIDTQVIHLQAALLTAALLMALPRLLADRVPVVVAWASVLLIGVAPSLVDQAGAGLADAPLAVFFAMAAVCGWRWLADGRREMLVLSALFAAAALATKREGTAFVAAFFLVMLIAAGGRRFAAAGAGVAALATALPWQLWLHTNGVDTSNGEIPYAKVIDPGYLAGRLGRIPTGAASLVWHALQPGAWLVIVPAAAIAVVLAARGGERRTAVFVAAVACLVLVSVVWAYWVGRPSLHYYLQHSARRVVTTPVVLLGAFLPVLWVAASRGRRAGDRL